MSVALLLARVPNQQLQDRALAELLAGDFTFKGAAELLQYNYSLALDRAPFPVADTQLVSGAPACGACPNNTMNQGDLFGDVPKGALCTDPTCYRQKAAAHTKLRLAEVKAAGSQVLEPAAAKKVMPYLGEKYGNDEYVAPGSGLVKLDDVCLEDPKGRTYRKLLGSHVEPEAVKVIANDKKGLVVELVDRKTATAGLKAAGHNFAKDLSASRPAGNDRHALEQKRREDRARQETRVRTLILQAIHEKAPEQLSLEDLRMVAATFASRVWDDSRKRLITLWGLNAKGPRAGSSSVLEKAVATFSQADTIRFLLDCAVIGEVHVGSYGGTMPATKLLALAKRYRVDADKIRKAELAAITEKKKAKAPKPARKKPAGPLARKANATKPGKGKAAA
jgi:hypothetical protein